MTTWEKFKEQIQNLGFELIISRYFNYHEIKPEFIIAAHRTKFLLLSATSYIGENDVRVNFCYIYGTLDNSIEFTEDQYRKLIYVSTGKYQFGQHFEFDHTNFVWYLDEFEKMFTFSKWNDPDRFMWLIDYSQDHNDWAKERDKFLATAPDWVRGFILPDEEHVKLIEQAKAERAVRNK